MIPDRLIEKVHLGEATDAERARVLADPDAKARLEALPALDRAFLAAHPADELVPKIEARARIAVARDDAARRRAAIGGAFLMPLLAAGLGLLLLKPGGQPIGGEPGLEPTTAKGPARLRVYRQEASGAVQLADGTAAKAGDRIQLGIFRGHATDAVVLSIDGRGEVTLHFPEAPAAPTVLVGTGEVALPQAYELDDAPEFERFFLVADDAPVPVGAVLDAARTLAGKPEARTRPLVLPPGLAQSSIVLRKEP